MATARGFDDYARSVRSYLHRDAYDLCRDWHKAEDLVQVTLEKVFLRWEYLNDHSLLGAYSRRTLLYSYISDRRQRRWRYEVTVAEVPDYGRPDEANETDQQLWAAMDGLGARQRQVIILRFWNDLSVDQAAAVMGCTAGTITSQTHRALARLRVALTTRHTSWDASVPGPRRGSLLKS